MTDPRSLAAGLAAAVVALALSCAAVSQQSQSGAAAREPGHRAGGPNAPARGRASDAAAPISDRAFARALEQALERIGDEPETTRLPALRQQLGRRRLEGAAPEVRVEREAPESVPRGEDLRAAVLPGVVTVSRRYLCGRCSDWHAAHASGFAIADGVVVTNHHVVDAGEDGVLAVGDATGAVHPVVEVLAADPRADLAVLRLGGDGPFPAPLALAETASVGSDVYVLGHPDGHFFYFSRGLIARNVRAGRGEGRDRLEITADFARGSSGAPVLDRWGRVVGVAAATHSVYYEENPDAHLQMVFKFATPTAALLRLLGDRE